MMLMQMDIPHPIINALSVSNLWKILFTNLKGNIPLKFLMILEAKSWILLMI